MDAASGGKGREGEGGASMATHPRDGCGAWNRFGPNRAPKPRPHRASFPRLAHPRAMAPRPLSFIAAGAGLRPVHPRLRAPNGCAPGFRLTRPVYPLIRVHAPARSRAPADRRRSNPYPRARGCACTRTLGPACPSRRAGTPRPRAYLYTRGRVSVGPHQPSPSPPQRRTIVIRPLVELSWRSGRKLPSSSSSSRPASCLPSSTPN